MKTIFSQIIEREIPANIIAEDEHNIAILDAFPIAYGHTLCIPKNPVDKLFDLPIKDYLSLQEFTYSIANALEQAMECKRIGEMVLGLEVPHAHIHLIPIQKESDLSFANPRLKFSDQEYQKMIEDIQKLL